MNAREHAVRYEIRVLGVLDSRWSSWFSSLDVVSDARGETTLTGPLRDQAALHGVLTRVRDLGLPLISVRRLDLDPTNTGEPTGDARDTDPRHRSR
jgi:hypothetical protein